MKTLIFDPFSGASGDMILGSLIDLGADADLIKNTVESIADVNFECKKTKKHGISATKVNISTNKDTYSTYPQIIDLIKSSNLQKEIIFDALSIFDKIASAESKIHNVPKDKLHFHEVGQFDAIADVIGSCIAFHNLGLNKYKVYCTIISVGSGFINYAHGKLPIPAPATLEILCNSNLIWKTGPVNYELLTPTGAAILSHFVSESGNIPQIRTEKTGYGAGFADFEFPNVLRVIIGEVEGYLLEDKIEVLETNVDDVTGEVLGNLIEELLREGALDVSIIPVTMKKSRSGHIIQVICNTIDSHKLAYKIIRETGSIGVRVIPVKHRLIASRKIDYGIINVNGIEYKVRVKKAYDLKGNILNSKPEFEDCKKISKETGVPVKDIIKRVKS
ncbi:MAG: nickel pincer cofactor biosynthesis protein LarC [Methanosarcinales archaeon]